MELSIFSIFYTNTVNISSHLMVTSVCLHVTVFLTLWAFVNDHIMNLMMDIFN